MNLGTAANVLSVFLGPILLVASLKSSLWGTPCIGFLRILRVSSAILGLALMFSVLVGIFSPNPSGKQIGFFCLGVGCAVFAAIPRFWRKHRTQSGKAARALCAIMGAALIAQLLMIYPKAV